MSVSFSIAEIGDYCTLVAMVEGSGADNNGYSTMHLLPNNVIRIEGHRKQADYKWA